VTSFPSEISSGFHLADLETPLIDDGPIHAFMRVHKSIAFEDNMGCLEIAS